MAVRPSPALSSPVNRPHWLALRRLLRAVLRHPIRISGRLRVDGAERLPKRRRPLVIAANHAAFIDSVYLILALTPRFTICGAKPRLFRSATLRSLMALANILKVESDERYLSDCATLLDAGEILLIYPEMGRFPEELGPFKTLAAEVALAAGAPILPCYIYGTTQGHRGKPRLLVGEEIPTADSTEDAATLTARLRREILALAPPEV